MNTSKQMLLIPLALSLALSLPALASTSDIYQTGCAVCHGADGTGGIPGTPDFTSKTGPLAKDDHTLHMNISNGFQSPGSAMAMPPKGGNPNLSNDEIMALVSYMKQKFYVK